MRNWIAYCESPLNLVYVPNQPDEDSVRDVVGGIHGTDGDEFSIRPIPENPSTPFVDLSDML